MCGAPLDVLLAGTTQPALQRVNSAAAPTSVGREAAESSNASRTASALDRQLLSELEAAASAALHCPTCNGWLSDPVTLSCGHSLCRVHTLCNSARETHDDASVGAADADVECPVCGQAEGAAVRDFLLGQCAEAFRGGSLEAAARLTVKPLPPSRSKEPKATLSISDPEGCPPPKKRIRATSCRRRSQPELPSGLATGNHGLLHCSICLENFPEPRRVPALPECGHALCNECASRIQRRSKKCPLCKASMTKSLRPCRQLRIAMRFINAVTELSTCEPSLHFEDLLETRAAVLTYRNKAAEGLALPLHQALHEVNIDQVAELLRQRVNCNQLINGRSALHVAVSSRLFHLVQQLLDAGADPALPSLGSVETPLLLACGADCGRVMSDPARLQAVQAMLSILHPEAGRTAVRTASAAGATPLHRVAQRLAELPSLLFSSGHFEEELSLARQLIEMGADIHATNIFGQSPAQMVAAVKRADLRELFGLAPVESSLS